MLSVSVMSDHARDTWPAEFVSMTLSCTLPPVGGSRINHWSVGVWSCWRWLVDDWSKDAVAHVCQGTRTSQAYLKTTPMLRDYLVDTFSSTPSKSRLESGEQRF